MGDIFRRLKIVEVAITELQEYKDWKGGLADHDLADLWGKLSDSHSFLRQQEILWR